MQSGSEYKPQFLKVGLALCNDEVVGWMFKLRQT